MPAAIRRAEPPAPPPADVLKSFAQVRFLRKPTGETEVHAQASPEFWATVKRFGTRTWNHATGVVVGRVEGAALDSGYADVLWPLFTAAAAEPDGLRVTLACEFKTAAQLTAAADWLRTWLREWYEERLRPLDLTVSLVAHCLAPEPPAGAARPLAGPAASAANAAAAPQPEPDPAVATVGAPDDDDDEPADED